MPHIDKALVTNVAALKAKYGSGLTALSAAIRRHIASDAKRGLTTKLIALDDATRMRRLGGAAVKNAGNPKQNKDPIDAVFTSLTPDYVVLLGSIDIIPHQDLTNLVTDDD